VRSRKPAKLLISLLILLSPSSPLAPSDAQAQASVTSAAIEHYSDCVRNARDRNFFGDNIVHGERYIVYRCHDDVAIAYFNYLGRIRARQRTVVELTGTYVYRTIVGVGRCWQKIVDAAGYVTSAFGCDVYDEI
jgi:hypothetical protein